MSALTKQRCAIYTRKSSEEGLDQLFNSLDAQREACEAYITSQASLGWRILPSFYDDGGISGGTMERPALQRLLQDIRDKKIDIVVVYKIDRLTRSLMDFARIVEIFDGSGVSFVSVTQQFNTTTSMGRLTLNVLLSFAQFEREVTAERIRDKIAASKKKGMWMGGRVPFGYEARDRKLIVHETQAQEVRGLFDRYLALKSVPALAAEVNRSLSEKRVDADGAQSDPKRAPFAETAASHRGNTGRLYYLLSNPIYIGKVRHKGVMTAGEHEAIIEQEVFDRAQVLLKMQAPVRKASATAADVHLLTGMLVDEKGNAFRPVHAQNHGKRYRYYVASTDKGSGVSNGSAWRLPLERIEPIVERQLHAVLDDESSLVTWITEHRGSSAITHALDGARRIKTEYAELDDPQLKRTLLGQVFSRIIITAEFIRFEVDVANLVVVLMREEGSLPRTEGRASDVVSVDIPIEFKRRGVEGRIVVYGAGKAPANLDPHLIGLVAKAHLYLEALTGGSCASINDAATRFGVHRADVSRILPLAYLSPKVTEAILTGCQPADLTVGKLTRLLDLPIIWDEQHRLLERNLTK